MRHRGGYQVLASLAAAALLVGAGAAAPVRTGSQAVFGVGDGLKLDGAGQAYPFPSATGDLDPFGPMCLAPDGSLLVSVQAGREVHSRGPERRSFGVASLWRVDLSDRQNYGRKERGAPLPYVESDVPFTRVTGMAATRDAVWVGTDKGLLRVAGGEAHVFRPNYRVVLGSMAYPFEGWPRGVRQVATDAAGRVWVRGDVWPPVALVVFEPREKDTEVAARALRAGLGGVGMATPAAGGIWLLSLAPGGFTAPVYVPPGTPPAPDKAGKTALASGISDVLGYPVPEEEALLTRAPRLPLARLKFAADHWGGLWVAGQDEKRVRIFRSVRQATTEQKGFEGLLGGGRITDVATDARGWAYFATDTAGVLVYGGGKWQPHPINDRLPRLAPTNLKPVNRVLALPGGGLAVCTGSHLLIWWPN